MTFVVFSLPRSRSAWLSAFLGGSHDLGVECAEPEDFVARLGAGSCETGAAFAWPLMRELLPDCAFAVVRRDTDEVIASLTRLGFRNVEAEMRQRAADLDAVSADPNVLTVQYGELASPVVCGGLYAHCLGERMPLERWRQYDQLNIQVDLQRQLQRLAANAETIERLKATVRRRMAPKGYSVALEPWSAAFWEEARPLAETHFEEVDGGVEPRRPFKLDLNVMGQLAGAGVLKMITARLDGRLVGYFTWNISYDVESAGLLIAQQGAWFIEAGHPRLMTQMFDASVRELRALGVKMVFPHHRLQGRGLRLGKLFERRGAKATQHTYSLWIGTDNA